MDKAESMFGCGGFEFGTDEMFECYSCRCIWIWDIEKEIWNRRCEAHCD